MGIKSFFADSFFSNKAQMDGDVPETHSNQKPPLSPAQMEYMEKARIHAEERTRIIAEIQKGQFDFGALSEEWRSTPEVALAAVQKNGIALGLAAGKARYNPAVILAAVQNDGNALQYVREPLINDPNIVAAAVQNNPSAIRHAPEWLQYKLSIMAVQKDATALDVLPYEMRGIPEVMMAAVGQNGMALRLGSPENIQNNPDIFRAAVQQNWRAFKYGSDDLKRDPELFNLAWEQKKAQTIPQSQVLNFMWLNLDLPAPPDPADGSIRLPMPEEYIGNVREAGERHPAADIVLWVDSRRLTQKQLDYLETVVEHGLPNVHVKDLCTIPEYINEELYSRSETDAKWRDMYKGDIWLQVDSAKILVSLQGNYSQSFFADLDHAHVDIESFEVQKMLHENGLMIGSGGSSYNSLENQLWGFDLSKKGFFENYNADGLRESYKGTIAYASLQPKVDREIYAFENVPRNSISLPIDSKGLAHAEHPGHEVGNGSSHRESSYKGRDFVPASELTAVFNTRNNRGAPALVQTAAAATVASLRRQGAVFKK